MKLLVNKQECSKYLSVSLFRKDEEFNRFIREAQMFDLKGLVCESFFQDLTNETPVRDYTLLLEGGSYTFEGKKYEFAGLKAVKDKKVYGNPKGVFSWDRYGAESALQILWAGTIIQPELFADIDVKAETKAFYKKFMNYELSDGEFEYILKGLNPDGK